MLRIKQNTRSAGPQGHTAPGYVVDLPADQALHVIANRRGEFVLEPCTGAAVPEGEFKPTQLAIKAEWTAVLAEMEHLVYEFDKAEADIEALEVKTAEDFDDYSVDDLRKKIGTAVLDGDVETRKLRVFQTALRGRYMRRAKKLRDEYVAWVGVEMAKHQGQIDVLAEKAAVQMSELVGVLDEIRDLHSAAFADLGIFYPVGWFPAEFVEGLKHQLQVYAEEKAARTA